MYEARAPNGRSTAFGPITIDGGLPATATLGAYPNPGHDRVQMFLNVPRPGRLVMRIYDVAGRRIRSLFDAPSKAGPSVILWDGSDDAGSPVSPGLYFVRASWPGGRASVRIVRSR